jgi:hypothetical protein
MLMGILFFLPSLLTAQAPATIWENRFGRNGLNALSSVIATPDGGAILAGTTLAFTAGGDVSQGSKGYNDYWIVKVDSSGNKQWDKRYGGPGDDFLTSIIPTIDGGYLLGGYSRSGARGDKSEANRGIVDYWIVKINSAGRKQWDKTFGGSGYDSFKSLIPTVDGGYLLFGSSDSGADGDKSEASNGSNDYWIVKITSTGTKQWDKTFGGEDSDYLESVATTPDGGYLLGGYSSSGISGDKTEASKGDSDFWIVKITGTGTKQWDKTLGGSGTDQLASLIATVDGGYLLFGDSNTGIDGDKSENSKGGFDYWLVKINSSGSKLWDKVYGTTEWEDLESAIPMADGGYLLAGGSNGGINGDKSEACQFFLCPWLLKINGEGLKQWDKSFNVDGFELRSVTQTSDRGYVVGGYKAVGEEGYEADYGAIKTSPDSVYSPSATFRVNSGGGAFTTTDGRKFEVDRYVTGGYLAPVASGEVGNTVEDALFLDARQGGTITYQFPTGNGQFKVLLHFNESYYGSQVPGGVGSRTFKVTIEGVRRLTEYDIFAKAGGAMKAITESFTTQVTDSVLTVQLVRGSKGLALISAIEILPVTTTVSPRLATKPAIRTELAFASLTPNPVQDRLLLTLSPSDAQLQALQITDLAGRVYVRTNPNSTPGNQVELAVEQLRAGVYILKVETQQGVQTLKFIKQ